MAIQGRSLFLYDYEITQLNSSLDFRAVMGGPVLFATLNFGFYSLTSLITEIARAMLTADPNRDYIVTADRSAAGGLQNRVTISTTGTYLDLLFGSGPRSASSIASIIGFGSGDQTGATSYTGIATSGIVLIPTFAPYNYLGPESQQKVFGTVNVSASGSKEAIVFGIQSFVQTQFKYEPTSRLVPDWQPLLQWMMQQRLFEYTPDFANDPNTFYEVTLEKSPADGKGLGFKHTEMLPDFPGLYDLGLWTFRLNQT